jgi:AcrR family transcriptional regulator
MAYRRTESVARRLAEREQSIVDAAREAAVQGGMHAVQIARVAERAGIAAGTVYRYFPAKTDLVTELISVVAERELAAIRRAADAAPGPLSALAAALSTLAARLLRERRLAWAVLAEPIDQQTDQARLEFRKAITAELGTRIRIAIAHKHVPEQDVAVSAPAVVGALLEGLIGPQAPEFAETAKQRAVQDATLLALRALGVLDARARGLVAQLTLSAAR